MSRRLLAPVFVSAVSAAQGAGPPPTRQLTSSTAYHYTAEVHAPVKREGSVKAGVITWQCKATRCTVSGPWPNPDVAACKALAQAVGEIKRYGHATKSLSAAQLAGCNAQKGAVGTLLPAKPAAATPATSRSGPGALGAASVRPLPENSNGPLQPHAKSSVPSTVLKAPAPAVTMPTTQQKALSSRTATASGGFTPPASGIRSGLRSASAPTSSTGAVGLAARTITTGDLTMTGLRFQAKTVTTGPLAMTGLGFSPKTLTTGELTMAGLRFHATTISTGELAMTGLGFSPKTLSTGGLTMNGLGFHAKTISTGELTMMGLGFSPKRINTGALLMTGTGVSQ